MNDIKFFYRQSIRNILTNVALLALPVGSIWNLQTPQVQKVILTGMFATGRLYVNTFPVLRLSADCDFSVIAISIARLNFLIRPDPMTPDITWNFVNVEMWTLLEMGFARVSGMFAFSYERIGAHGITPSISTPQHALPLQDPL